MAAKIRVIQYGLGPIGSAMARHVLEREGHICPQASAPFAPTSLSSPAAELAPSVNPTPRVPRR